METLDTRRLTGANVIWDLPGSVIDASCTQDEAERLIVVWQELARAMLDALGWEGEETCVRRYGYGVSLALSAPIDALYLSCEVNGWLWAASLEVLAGGAAPDIAEAAVGFRKAMADEANPALLALRDAAAARGLAFLSDDDFASVGLGTGSHCWPVRALPKPDEVSWKDVHEVPLVLVTGTNGKTTTTRMVAAMAVADGRTVGLTSTDGIRVAGEFVERGDFSGPGGARRVLRDRRVQTAVLETARGGLLRRGLGVQRADAVAITTIAEDHLGDFGSRSVQELLAVKWVLTRALSGPGQLVLNADEPRLVQKAREARAKISWFSLDANNPVVRRHVEQQGRAAVLDGGEFVLIDERRELRLCHVDEVPLTVGGAARHNISNALAAAALAWALGISSEAIAKALRNTRFEDNPGRCNLFTIEGRHVLVDFAHNVQAMQAVLDFAGELPARRRLLSFGQAGDRPDEAIEALAIKAGEMGFDRIHTVELPKYERGRQPGEVCALLRRGLLRAGVAPSSIHFFPSEQDSLNAALKWAEPADLVLILAVANSAEIVAQLQELRSAPA